MLPAVLVPQSLAEREGWETSEPMFFVRYGSDATRDDVDTAIVAAERVGAGANIDEGPDYPRGALLAVLAAIAGLVTLAGVAISVALAAAEGRADLATLAAVGADPRRRRALSAAQALLVAGLGCALGLVFGTYVAVISQATTGAPELVVPWSSLLVTGVVVPLVAVLVAAAVTPGRLPLVRRLA
jgi:putative ABC transport system permease protein